MVYSVIVNNEDVRLFFKNKLSHSFEIFTDQFVYGHREILLNYAELPSNSILLGKLQHGATPINYDINFNSPKFRGNRSPFWVFMKESEIAAHKSGHHNVKAIGAPWLYLISLLENNEKKHDLPSSKFLIMPEHSTVNYINRTSAKIKNKRAKFFRDLVGNNLSTVCLHWNDFLDTETRQAFIDLGFKVTCVGTGFNLTPWSPGGDRVRFLPNLRNLLETHTHWVGESFNTSMFYAMSMGLNIGIFVDNPNYFEMGKSGYAISDGHFLKIHNLYLEELGSTMKSSLNDFNKNDEHGEIWKKYLGNSNILDPTELASILSYEFTTFLPVVNHFLE